jgi:hypothetical protein
MEITSHPIRFFDIGSSANHMFLPFIFRPIRFFGVGNSANHMFLPFIFRPIRFFGVGNSANHMFLPFISVQSDSSMVEVQPIRCFCHLAPAL